MRITAQGGRGIASWLLVGLTACACRETADEARAGANDNRVAAGQLRDGVLTLKLEARDARWFPDGDAGPSLLMPMFAEVGRDPQNPGPLIRVAAGTTIHVSVTNTLRRSTLVVYGLGTRPSTLTDTMQVAPGATRERSFLAGDPGTYFYWGSTTDQPIADRNGIDSQLHGAFVVDSAGVTPPPDRIFVLGSWTGRRPGSLIGVRVE